MDFFEENNNNFIEVWVKEMGKRLNTYVYGWDIEDIELRKHLKSIKKNKGCNGSITELVTETGEIKVLQLQGNHKDYVIEYLKKNGISESSIKIKV